MSEQLTRTRIASAAARCRPHLEDLRSLAAELSVAGFDADAEMVARSAGRLANVLRRVEWKNSEPT